MEGAKRRGKGAEVTLAPERGPAAWAAAGAAAWAKVWAEVQEAARCESGRPLAAPAAAGLKRDRLSPGPTRSADPEAAAMSDPGCLTRAAQAARGGSGPLEDGDRAVKALPRPRGSCGSGPFPVCGDEEAVTVMDDDPEEAGPRRPLSTAYCQLCHGKFSSPSLHLVFGRVSGESREKRRRTEQDFFVDFQRLLGVAIHQDPGLPQFVCESCHAQFYECHSILKAFLWRVSMSPEGPRKPQGKGGADNGSQA